MDVTCGLLPFARITSVRFKGTVSVARPDLGSGTRNTPSGGAPKDTGASIGSGADAVPIIKGSRRVHRSSTDLVF